MNRRHVLPKIVPSPLIRTFPQHVDITRIAPYAHDRYDASRFNSAETDAIDTFHIPAEAGGPLVKLNRNGWL